MRKKGGKKLLVACAMSIVLCAVMLAGTTWAWFTDSVTNAGNKIQAGTLDVSLLAAKSDGAGGYGALADVSGSAEPIFKDENWEPGYSTGVKLAVKNNGTLSLKYKLTFGNLSATKGIEAVLEVAVDGTPVGTLSEFVSGAAFLEGTLAGGETSAEKTVVVTMQTSAGNDYQGASAIFDIRLVATQTAAEEDGFGNSDYDKDAPYPWDGMTVTEVLPRVEEVQGVQTEIYPVTNGAELAWISEQVNNPRTRAVSELYIVLQSDIDLNGMPWAPIGGDLPFTGTFDGAGHTIKNLTSSVNPNSSTSNRGIALFGYAENAVIKNLKIENCDISARYAASAVVGDGCAPLLFENIEVSGTICADQNVTNKYAQVAGGILGQGFPGGADQEIIFRNCVNRADITVNKWHAGGLWGSVTTSEGNTVARILVENCQNYGNMTAIGEDNGGYAGGLGAFASVGNCTITGSANYGVLTAPTHVGELVAWYSKTGAAITENNGENV